MESSQRLTNGAAHAHSSHHRGSIFSNNNNYQPQLTPNRLNNNNNNDNHIWMTEASEKTPTGPNNGSNGEPMSGRTTVRASLRDQYYNASARDRLALMMAERRAMRKPPEKYSLPGQVRDNVEVGDFEKDFCATTSAHGLPRVAAAPSTYQSVLWSLIFLLCLGAFTGQAYWIIEKFRRNEKIVNVELRFETMPFPAVTICNLNPFKRSLAEQMTAVQDMLNAFDSVIQSASESKSSGRFKRDVSYLTEDNQPTEQLISILAAKCRCSKRINGINETLICVTEEELNVNNYGLETSKRKRLTSDCLCAYHSETRVKWPCYDRTRWTIQQCHECDTIFGICASHPFGETKCWCSDVTDLCVKDDLLDNQSGIDNEQVTKLTIHINRPNNADQLSMSTELPKNSLSITPVSVTCECDNKTAACHPIGFAQPTNPDSTCLCVLAKEHGQLGYCSLSTDWHRTDCRNCQPTGFCAYQPPIDNSMFVNPELTSQPCHCQSAHCLCVATDTNTTIDTLPKLWTLPTNNGTDTIATQKVDNNEIDIENPRHSRQRRDALPEIFQNHYSKLKMRPRRLSDPTSYFQPAVVSCDCDTGRSTCRALTMHKPKENDTICLCPLNTVAIEKLHTAKATETLWPCYERSEWRPRLCARCRQSGMCDYVSPEHTLIGTRGCLCADTTKFCVAMEGKFSEIDKNDTEIMELFEESILDVEAAWLDDLIQNDTAFVKVWSASTVPPNRDAEKAVKRKEEALGFQGMTDQTAIRSRARENLMFATTSLDPSERQAMSTPKEEFIKQCSFNGKQCSVDDDFELQLDPSFGNCYTFDISKGGSSNTTSDRAGPNYGLRMLIFVNVSEYLPTTEASGVRITVHPDYEEPFPDTVGFSAPVGSVSSFGIHLKRVDRLPKPYGDCVDDGKTDKFIYHDKSYSVEGCHRSCLQHALVGLCGCGDPRFPAINNETSNCKLDDPDKRQCLTDGVNLVSKDRDKDSDGCSCPQPCKQFIYSVSYSAATWPASHSQANCMDMGPEECLTYYRNEAVMIEIFYEALNYEALKETDAYGWPNLLSDFGGQLGLWMGVSVITCMEFLILVWSLLTMCFCCTKSQTYSVGRENGSIMSPDEQLPLQPMYRTIDSEYDRSRRRSQMLRTGPGGEQEKFFLV